MRELVIGVAPDASTRRSRRQRSARTSLKKCWSTNRSRPGNVLYIPAGTIHALGPGLLVYEIQQSSDTTYRLYDWGRMGLDGKPRPLHIEKRLAGGAARQAAGDHALSRGERDTRSSSVVDSPFFKTVLHQLRGNSVDLDTEGRRLSRADLHRGGSAKITTGDGSGHAGHRADGARFRRLIGRYTHHGDGEDSTLVSDRLSGSRMRKVLPMPGLALDFDAALDAPRRSWRQSTSPSPARPTGRCPSPR